MRAYIHWGANTCLCVGSYRELSVEGDIPISFCKELAPSLPKTYHLGYWSPKQPFRAYYLGTWGYYIILVQVSGHRHFDKAKKVSVTVLQLSSVHLRDSAGNVADIGSTGLLKVHCKLDCLNFLI